MHWIDALISFFPSVSLCVCEQIGCRTITFTTLYRFSPNFACGSEMWSHQRLLFVRQTGSSLPILEACGFRFRHFSDSDDYIFQQISTKYYAQLKFSNADFVFNGEWNRKYNSDFRDVQIPVWVSALDRPRSIEHSYACRYMILWEICTLTAYRFAHLTCKL